LSKIIILKFQLQHIDPESNARCGLIETDHGSINTPVFAPVGTLGSVRGIHTRELENDAGINLVLGNA